MSHYFQTPTEPTRKHTIDVTIWGRRYPLTTSDGVFSMSRLDKGTAVLLNELDPPNGLTEPAVPGEAVAAEPSSTWGVVTAPSAVPWPIRCPRPGSSGWTSTIRPYAWPTSMRGVSDSPTA